MLYLYIISSFIIFNNSKQQNICRGKNGSITCDLKYSFWTAVSKITQ